MTHRDNHILRGVTGVVLLGFFMTMTTGCSRLSKLVSDIEALEDVDYQKVEQTLDSYEMEDYSVGELTEDHHNQACKNKRHHHRKVFKTVNNTTNYNTDNYNTDNYETTNYNTDNYYTYNYNTYNYNSNSNKEGMGVDFANEVPVEVAYTPEEIIVEDVQVIEEVVMIPAIVEQEVVYVEPVEAAEVDMDINIDIDMQINSEVASEEPIIEDEAAHHPEVID